MERRRFLNAYQATMTKRKTPCQRGLLDLGRSTDWRGNVEDTQTRSCAQDTGGSPGAARTVYTVAGADGRSKEAEMAACSRVSHSGRATAEKVGESVRAISAPFTLILRWPCQTATAAL